MTPGSAGQALAAAGASLSRVVTELIGAAEAADALRARAWGPQRSPGLASRSAAAAVTSGLLAARAHGRAAATAVADTAQRPTPDPTRRRPTTHTATRAPDLPTPLFPRSR